MTPAAVATPRGPAEALARIALAPRSGLAAAVAAELDEHLAVDALVLVTPHCPRAPVKWHGAWPGPAMSDARIHELASGAPPGTSTAPLDADPDRPLLLLRATTATAEPSTLGLLVATGEELSALALRGAVELWAVLAVMLEDRDRTGGDDPGAIVSSNVAAAEEVRRVGSASTQAHAADLTDVLGALRADRSSDRSARARATEVASRALVRLRAAPRADAGLSAGTLADLHARLAPEVASSLRDHRMTGGVAAPVEDALLNREVVTAVELLSRAAVGAVLDARADVAGAAARPDRLTVEWRPVDAAVAVTVRTDAPGAPDTAHLGRYLSALGGRLDERRDPVWGRELVATVPMVTGVPRRSPALAALTDRELEALARLEAGASNRMIATAWGVSESTVKFHVRNVMLKLGARSRSEAVALSRRS